MNMDLNCAGNQLEYIEIVYFVYLQFYHKLNVSITLPKRAIEAPP